MYDVTIIGSGPAGYTAALYTSRAFLKTAIITGEQLGGQLTTTTDVDNFPGFEKGITGPELVEVMKKQVERFGTEIKSDIVTHIEPHTKNSTFRICGQSKSYETRSVIISTGASAKKLGISSEETFRGKGISYCATCDGFFFRNKNVAVLGGGDTAMEEATFLTKFASHVTLIHRRNEFRASPIMVEKARKDPKITILTNKIVEEFIGDAVLRGLILRDAESNNVETILFDGAFVAIGHKPATDFLKGFIDLDDKGYVITRMQKTHNQKHSNSLMESQTSTSVPGIFAAGDCADPHYRQAIVAAGMGCMAALDVQKYLEA